MTARCSIVIPTRRRPRLVGGAVRSALVQTVEDIEVVVGNNGADAETAQLVERLDDPRLRLVTPPRPLLMHDSWAFAVEAATGRFVMVLGDDDALHPRTVEIALRESEALDADVVCWRACWWWDRDLEVAAQRGRFSFGPPFTDRVFDLDPGTLLDLAYDLRLVQSDLVPRMLNACVRRDLLKRLREAETRLFHPASPDYASMTVLAAHARRMLWIDAPLLVAGATAESIGASALHRGAAARQFADELVRGEPDLVLPPACYGQGVWMAQTLMQCARDVPALADRAVNATHAYALSGIELRRWRTAGVPVDALIDEFDAARAAQGSAFDDRVRTLIDAGVRLESDACVRSAVAGRCGLGLGPMRGPDGGAAEAGYGTIDVLAADLDGRLRRLGAPLGALASALQERAGSRRPVLYGMGRNGQAVHRLLDRDPAWACCDDAFRPGPHESATWIESVNLDPRLHFAVVTPDEPAALTRTLRSRRLVEGRDWIALEDAVESRGAGVVSGPVPVRVSGRA